MKEASEGGDAPTSRSDMNRNGARAKVLYIAGYGRSGSTVLATILGNHPEMVSAGEVCYLLEDWEDEARPCSCGEPYKKCEFWSGLPIEVVAPSDSRPKLRKIERAWAAPRVILGLTTKRERRAYRLYHQALFGHALRKSGKQIVVDSSKSARSTVARSRALLTMGGCDVYVVHLVRNGEDTLRSLAVTGSNWALEGHGGPKKLVTLRAIIGWVLANVSTSLIWRTLRPDRYLLVRYEDLLDDPVATISRIGSFIGLETSGLEKRVRQGETFEVGHMVGGNRLRFSGRVKLQVPGKRGRSGLKRSQRLLFVSLGGWLNRRYGYQS